MAETAKIYGFGVISELNFSDDFVRKLSDILSGGRKLRRNVRVNLCKIRRDGIRKEPFGNL